MSPNFISPLNLTLIKRKAVDLMHDIAEPEGLNGVLL